jgi:hypothetical protein
MLRALTDWFRGRSPARGSTRTGSRRTARRARPELEVLEDRTVLSPLTIVLPDGTYQITGFQEGPGNLLLTGIPSTGLAQGTVLEAYSQANMSAILGTNKLPLSTPGLNSTYQLTVVARCTEVVTSLVATGPTSSVATFALSSAQANPFFEVWFHNGLLADNFNGTGFATGTKILSGVLGNIPSATFSANVPPGPVALDNPFGAGGTAAGQAYWNGSGTTTVQGAGNSQLSLATMQVKSVVLNPAFFPLGQTITSYSLQATTDLAYQYVDPSKQFDALPNGGGFIASIPMGIRNGLGSAAGGADREVLETNDKESFTATNISVQGAYAGLDFNQSGGYTPPDTCGAAGPTNYVETVNQTVGIYSPKATGTSTVTDSFRHFWFTVGQLPRPTVNSNLSDPIVAYDELIGRFLIGDQDVDTGAHVSTFDIAVSKSSSPSTLTAADWNFYQINTTENMASGLAADYDADYPGNFGYNHDALVFTLNMFRGAAFDHALVTSVNASDLAAGVAQAQLHAYKNDVNAASLRPTTMHDSVAGDPMWLVSETGDGQHLNVYKMTNVLSNTPVYTLTQLAVNSYTNIAQVPPRQPNGTAITNDIDSRILKAAERNNTLVATHAVSVSPTQDAAQWYAIDLSTGTPTLQQQGDVSLGSNTYASYPGIDVNSAGALGMSFMDSGTAAGQFLSMYVTGRAASDPSGTMQTPVRVSAGTGVANYSDFAGPRAGDLSGINVDPADDSFWAANEFANTDATANWGTAIANFTVTNNTNSNAAASTLAVTGFPSPTVAGVAGTFTVIVRDSNGNIASGYRGTVHFTSSDPQAVLPADYTFTAADNGVHTFSTTLKTAGSQSLTATDTVTAALTGTQAGITVNPATASSLRVDYASTTTAGMASNALVTALDPYGNAATGFRGTVHLSSSDNQAVLAADYTYAASDNGVHAFLVTLKTAGSQALTARDLITSVNGTQANIVIIPAAANSFVVGGFPTPTTAGVAGLVTVIAKDPYGNIATGYRGTVHFTSSDPQAALPADYAFGPADNGVHNFSAALKTVGSRSLTATDTTMANLTATQAGIVVTPAAASSFVVAGFPSPTTAGVAGTFTVTARDAYGNLATGYRGTVLFLSSDPQAVLPADYTFVAADNGVHTFSATLKTAGSQDLVATDVAVGIGTQAGIMVNPAATSRLGVVGFPTPATAGVAGNVTVAAEDPYGNFVPGYRGTVRFRSSDPQAVLPANYTFVAADNGVHTFSATLKTAGTQALTATDTITTSITGTQAGIGVVPAAARSIVVAGFPSPETAGVAGVFTVTAKDPYGNIATGYRGTVHFTSSDSQALLPAGYTFAASDNGVHSFGANLSTAGNQSLTATDSANSLSGTQAGIVVKPAAASLFVLTGYPSPVTAGVSGNVRVTAQDPYGNTVTGYRGTIHFSSSDPQAVLPANYTFAAADNGTHLFSATLKTAGSQSVTATDTTTGGLTGTQAGITVKPAALSKLVVEGFPSAETAGVPDTFTVRASDAYGNTTPGYRGTIHFSSSDSRAVLPANYAFVAADNGVHTFSATLKTAGTQSLKAADTVTATIQGSQLGITVTPAAASRLVLSGPASVTAGVAFTLTVTAVDAYGNVATDYLGTVRFTSSDSTATLPANYTFKAADKGRHAFSGVVLRKKGTQAITVTDTLNPALTVTWSITVL